MNADNLLANKRANVDSGHKLRIFEQCHENCVLYVLIKQPGKPHYVVYFNKCNYYYISIEC